VTTEQVLDHGYVRLVESMGSDQMIVESARMSTKKGFLGWGPKHADGCTPSNGGNFDDCSCGMKAPGDEKLLKYLWDHQHTTPFEFGEMVVEVKAPIVVFREWHRHRTMSYSEMSARYVALPNENYIPTVERVMTGNALNANKQAQGSGRVISEYESADWLCELARAYDLSQKVYEKGISLGVPKELARLPVPVGRYSAMRAKANLLNWFKFLKLRCDSDAQQEIRDYSNIVARFAKQLFPRTYDVARTSLGLP
jgi:thymidylate synthase (FAD)